MTAKRGKIINDPVHGFINIPSDIIHDIIEHPYFQRLRRIKQLGLTYYVYPGAIHTRFQHGLGAMHLMSSAIDVIRSKGHDITEAEARAARCAILLHDIGHGPFSHALEHTLIKGIRHEILSEILMKKLDMEFGGALTTAIDIFTGRYKKKFLHQLVSGQLDMDRMDYLKRDSYFTGVSEGVIGSDRIIKMLNVVNDQLVVEQKGIYSIENFLIARRLMFWQVYFHKTAIGAEKLLISILRRANDLVQQGEKLFCTPGLEYFLYNPEQERQPENLEKIVDYFVLLDDNDILASVKAWAVHPDKILSLLSKNLLYRKLFRIEIQNSPYRKEKLQNIQSQIISSLNLNKEEARYFLISGEISNKTYTAADERINIMLKTGELPDISEASDMLKIDMLAKEVKKYYLCYPKKIY